MAQTMVLTLLQCCVWSGGLWFITQQLQRRIPALTQWPAFYWLTLVLCFLPLLPAPQFAAVWQLPSVLLQDTVLSVQTLTAQPQHPGISQSLLHWQLIWPSALTAILLVSVWQLINVAQQWRQLQRLIELAEPLPLPSLLNTRQRSQLPSGFALRQTALAVSPFVASGWRAALVVPAYIWHLPRQQRELLITHEVVHLRRRDPQQLLLLRVVVACCWFMPALRYLERAFQHSIELAVDREVLQQHPGQAAQRFVGHAAIGFHPVGLGAWQQFHDGAAHSVLGAQPGHALKTGVDGQVAVVHRFALFVAQDFVQRKAVEHFVEQHLVTAFHLQALGDVLQGAHQRIAFGRADSA